MLFIDFEVFKHDWLCVVEIPYTDPIVIVNDTAALSRLYERHIKDVWIGSNIKGYDQYILKGILLGINPYAISDYIINGDNFGWQYTDDFKLFPLNVFDVQKTKRSLKESEAHAGHDIEETQVDFNLDRKLTEKEIELTEFYCRHDVSETIEVFMDDIDEFETKLEILNSFKLNLKHISKSYSQLASLVFGARQGLGEEQADKYDLILPEVNTDMANEIADWFEGIFDEDQETYYVKQGVQHRIAGGGIHGCVEPMNSKGNYLLIDAVSYYPTLMIEYDLYSRNLTNRDKFNEVYDKRLAYKDVGNKRKAQAYKKLINNAYGAMGDPFNKLYDLKMRNSIVATGQILLIELMEMLADDCKILFSNTDGILIEYDDFDVVDEICADWEDAYGIRLDFEEIDRVILKDVNNYILIGDDIQRVGAYTKKLSKYDNDLPILNKAVVEYLLNGKKPEETVFSSNDLMDFQKVVKLPAGSIGARYGYEEYSERVYRVFASDSLQHNELKAVKSNGLHSIAGIPELVFIDNGDVRGKTIPEYLDYTWYIAEAWSRIDDFKAKTIDYIKPDEITDDMLPF